MSNICLNNDSKGSWFRKATKSFSLNNVKQPCSSSSSPSESTRTQGSTGAGSPRKGACNANKVFLSYKMRTTDLKFLEISYLSKNI